MIVDEWKFNKTLSELLHFEHEDEDLNSEARVEVSAKLGQVLKDQPPSDRVPWRPVFEALDAEITRKWKKPQEVQPPLDEMVQKLGDVYERCGHRRLKNTISGSRASLMSTRPTASDA